MYKSMKEDSLLTKKDLGIQQAVFPMPVLMVAA